MGKEKELKVGIENYRHVKSCARYVRTNLGLKNVKYCNGYKIYLWCKKYLDAPNKLDFTIQEFWVCKKDHQKYKRGQKIMSRKKMQQFVANGGKVRTIRCHKKETRKAMRELLQYMNIHAPEQYGFVNNRDIFKLMEDASKFSLRRNFKTSVASIDLENAFEQITYTQVYAIFKYIFGINEKHSKKLAEISTTNGKLFQGNVISPIIFNLWFLRVYSRLEKVSMSSNNFKLFSYADDLTVITLYRSMSWKFLKFIMKVIEQCNFKINKTKTRITKGNHMEICGLQWKDIGYKWRVYGRKTQKLKKNIRMWKFILSKNPLAKTKRLNKNGQEIFALEMLKGLENWYSRVLQFQPI